MCTMELMSCLVDYRPAGFQAGFYFCAGFCAAEDKPVSLCPNRP